MWVSLIQSVENLKRKKTDLPWRRGNFTSRMSSDSSCNSSLGVQSARLFSRFWACQSSKLHNHVSQFFKINLSLYFSLSIYIYMYHIYICHTHKHTYAYTYSISLEPRLIHSSYVFHRHSKITVLGIFRYCSVLYSNCNLNFWYVFIYSF